MRCCNLVRNQEKTFDKALFDKERKREAVMPRV